MNTSSKTLGSFALLAVSANLVSVVILSFVLPERAQVFLPILGLALPFLTTWLLEYAGEVRPDGQTATELDHPQAAAARHALT